MRIRRRDLLFLTLASAGACRRARQRPMTHTERLDAVLVGKTPDRPPFTFYHHFHLEQYGGERHADATLNFHRRYQTDLVKVMSDFPFPKPEQGSWLRLQPVDNPFPEQVRALELISSGLAGSAYFVETIFNPFKVAENLSSPEQVRRLMDSRPDDFLEALHAIARSLVAHAKRAATLGARGIFLAVACADESVLSRQEYEQFSRPFDRMVLDAVADLPLNILHIHGRKPYLDLFLKGWPASVLQYSEAATHIPLAQIRAQYGGVLMGGVNELTYQRVSEEELRRQVEAAQRAAGARLIVAPGCSVPDDCTEPELLKLPNVLGA